jgi:hypothetical protein
MNGRVALLKGNFIMPTTDIYAVAGGFWLCQRVGASRFKGESGIWYAYQERLGKVVRNGGYFLPSKD